MATKKVQGTTLTVTRGMDSPLNIGEIQNASGLSSPANDINIGSWEDTIIKTRPGRKKLGQFTFDLFLNPDAEVQKALKEMQSTNEIAVFALVQPEGTIKTRTFSAMVSQFGEDAQNDNVLMGHITLVVTSNAVRT